MKNHLNAIMIRTKVFGKNKQFFILIMLLFFNVIVHSQIEYYMDLHREISKGNYLGYLDLIKKNIDTKKNYEGLSTTYSYLSDYKKSQKIFFSNQHIYDFTLDENKMFNDKDLKYKVIKGEKFLNDLKKYDIVLFNEAHHKPQHRIFIRTKLSKLYDLGFRYFFIEALSPGEKEINKRKYPLLKSLTYKEPSFGLLLREALDLGFKVFGYEYAGRTRRITSQERENYMFENIKSILDSLPKAKSILLGGYSHIATSILFEDEHIPLGNLLQKDYKVVSVDQTIYTEEHKPILEKEFYKSFSKKNKKTKILKINSNFWYDYTVIHPRTEYINNIASWYYSSSNSICFNIKENIELESKKDYLIQLYIKNEYSIHKNKSLPIFQTLISNVDTKITLPKYNFDNLLIIIRDSLGEILYKKQID